MMFILFWAKNNWNPSRNLKSILIILFCTSFQVAPNLQNPVQPILQLSILSGYHAMGSSEPPLQYYRLMSGRDRQLPPQGGHSPSKSPPRPITPNPSPWQVQLRHLFLHRMAAVMCSQTSMKRYKEQVCWTDLTSMGASHAVEHRQGVSKVRSSHCPVYSAPLQWFWWLSAQRNNTTNAKLFVQGTVSTAIMLQKSHTETGFNSNIC